MTNKVWMVGMMLIAFVIGMLFSQNTSAQQDEIGMGWTDRLNWDRIEVGMPEEQVIAILGQPIRRRDARVASGVSRWEYSGIVEGVGYVSGYISTRNRNVLFIFKPIRSTGREEAMNNSIQASRARLSGTTSSPQSTGTTSSPQSSWTTPQVADEIERIRARLNELETATPTATPTGTGRYQIAAAANDTLGAFFRIDTVTGRTNYCTFSIRLGRPGTVNLNSERCGLD